MPNDSLLEKLPLFDIIILMTLQPNKVDFNFYFPLHHFCILKGNQFFFFLSYQILFLATIFLTIPLPEVRPLILEEIDEVSELESSGELNGENKTICLSFLDNKSSK